MIHIIRNLRNLLIMICVGFFLPIISFAQAPNPTNIVNRLVMDYKLNENIPGVAVALYYNNKAYFYNFGVANRFTQQPVTRNTIFEIGSMTKAFTATLLAEQVLAGKIALNAPVVNYLPPYVKRVNGALNQVTLQELATHTSGLPSVPPGLELRERAYYNERDLMNFVAYWQPRVPIGTQYSYSNIGFGLLGYALEQVTGHSYAQLLQKNIFNPLGMQNSSLNYPVNQNLYAQGYNKFGRPAMRWPKNAWPAGGAIRSTAADMCKFLEANLSVTSSGASPQLIRAMQFAQKGIFPTGVFIQGLAWANMPNGIIRKDGGTSGFSSYIALLPNQHMGIVILTNKSQVHPAHLAAQILFQLRQ